MLSRTAAIVLAAGKGTRMKSARPKVLHRILGRPLIHFPLFLCQQLGVGRVVVVVGTGREDVEAAVTADFPDAGFALQKEQRGTGDAADAGFADTAGFDSVLILSGDVPGLTEDTLQRMAQAKADAGASLALLSFEPDSPTGYGRVIEDDTDHIQRIVEERDCTDAQRANRTCNAGIYLLDRELLGQCLSQIGTQNTQNERYLTDIAHIAHGLGKPGIAVLCENPDEVEGINSRGELAEASARYQADRNDALMAAGVTLVAPARTLVGFDVSLAPDVTLEPDVQLVGKTSVGSGSTVGQGSVITNTRVGKNVTIRPYCVISDSELDDNSMTGPFAHIRPGTHLHDGAKIGNFVETKKATIGPGSKASHLTYLGDCELGAGVNVGAGTITCNYDGVSKHRTVLEDGVFVGSNTEIIAPVRVGKGALIGAGTTLTKDVPEGALAVSRTEQRNVDGWSKRFGPAARKKKKE